MKIIVTGASGSIGSALIPYLNKKGYELILLGRDVKILRNKFPEYICYDHKNFFLAKTNYDACVHLAVMNNMTNGNLESFRSVNVGMLKSIFEYVKISGCHRFINITSFHAENQNRNDPYSISKREADSWLIQQDGIIITSLKIPAIYSESATGKLLYVNKLPTLFRPLILTCLGALSPIVNMARVVEAIEQAISESESGEKVIVNSADNNLLFKIFKKVIDLSFALAIILLGWWLLLAIYIAIKFAGNGPAIFTQERVGRYGKSFTCYKFRTMSIGTKQVGTHDLGRDTTTKLGRYLRKMKIDELPQIVNILRGELSLVGPRPCLPMQIQLVQERERRGVSKVLPGITGWAQVNDIDMSDPVKLSQTDADYIARRTIPFELFIVLRTFFGAGQGDRLKFNG